jgi:uncharacterized protein (DUF1697 family)
VALVALLRGLNVGGHRRFKPRSLAADLRHLDAVNIGAAGTLVIRTPVTRAQLRRDLARRLPFDAEIVICDGRDVLRLLSRHLFEGTPDASDVVRFVSVLSRRPRLMPQLPATFPAQGPWLLKVLARDDRFVVGLYRRQLKVIGYLNRLDALFGVPLTTRNWNTMRTIGKVLNSRRVKGAV